jgi:hypothetical protein
LPTSCDGRHWLGTFKTPELTRHVYGYSRPKFNINFPNVTSREEAGFFAGELQREEANPHHVQVEYEYYCQQD